MRRELAVHTARSASNKRQEESGMIRILLDFLGITDLEILVKGMRGLKMTHRQKREIKKELIFEMSLATAAIAFVCAAEIRHTRAWAWCKGQFHPCRTQCRDYNNRIPTLFGHVISAASPPMLRRG